MAADYKIDKERRLVISTGSGVFTKGDVLAHREKLFNDPDYDPSFSQLIDFTPVTQFWIEPEELQSLAQTMVFSANSRRAIVAPNDLIFGSARMYEILRESAGESGIRVFRNRDKGLDWVLAKSTSA
jgi:hypothetical protein